LESAIIGENLKINNNTPPLRLGFKSRRLFFLPRFFSGNCKNSEKSIKQQLKPVTTFSFIKKNHFWIDRLNE
jgi:hypothetical protein